MAHSKREVWEAAKAANLDGFIGKVSSVFGADAIKDVSITAGGKIWATSDDMFREPTRVGTEPVQEPHRIRQAREWAERKGLRKP